MCDKIIKLKIKIKQNNKIVTYGWFKTKIKRINQMEFLEELQYNLKQKNI